ncbi:MAG: hypothetical protein CMM25_06830 [Rhodospirillaceae bacterium]|nr:hypothetical protein [Rhodospirillaceae bacterium]
MLSSPLRLFQAVLLYIPTTFVIPNSALIFYALFSIIIFQPSFRNTDRLYFVFLVGVAVNSIIGILLKNQFPESLFVNNGVLGAVLLLLGYLSARTLNDKVWNFFLGFLIIEIFCIYIQFGLGIRFFFPGQEVVNMTTEFQFTQTVDDIDLLYFIRPMGLSDTSTIAGAKILLALILIFMLPLKSNYRILLTILCIGAAILNFKRSGLIAFGLLFLILLILDIKRHGWKPRHNFLGLSLTIIIAGYSPQIISQFTRETAISLEQVSASMIIEQLSGRAELWSQVASFITNNLFFGNYSERLQLVTGQYAHNSYLSVLATHGIFLTVILIVFIIRKAYQKPIILIFLLPLFADAIFQESLFWYISAFDQFVLYLLINRAPSVYWRDPIGSVSTKLVSTN